VFYVFAIAVLALFAFVLARAVRRSRAHHEIWHDSDVICKFQVHAQMRRSASGMFTALKTPGTGVELAITRDLIAVYMAPPFRRLGDLLGANHVFAVAGATMTSELLGATTNVFGRSARGEWIVLRAADTGERLDMALKRPSGSMSAMWDALVAAGVRPESLGPGVDSEY
jgi:hypothetical protein